MPPSVDIKRLVSNIMNALEIKKVDDWDE